MSDSARPVQLSIIAPFEKSLLLVIDVQNDFCSAGGALETRGADITPIQQMLPALHALLQVVRARGGHVVFTRHRYAPSILPPAIRRRDELLFGSQGFPLPDSWGEHFCAPVAPRNGETVCTKYQYSAFSCPEFRDYLAGFPDHTLLLTGALTNVCVETTAREADTRGYPVVLIEDCVASNSPALHGSTLHNIRQYFGWVCSSHELLAAWS